MGKVPILAVTATATDKIIEDVETVLGITSFTKILKIPNRYMYAYVHAMHMAIYTNNPCFIFINLVYIEDTKSRSVEFI